MKHVEGYVIKLTFGKHYNISGTCFISV